MRLTSAIAALERKYEVVVVTQNVDALHERAGSTKVLHLHGELAFARGTGPRAGVIASTVRRSASGQYCDEGTQLAPTSSGLARKPGTWTRRGDTSPPPTRSG